MGRVSLLALLLTLTGCTACGSTYIAAPSPPPPFDGCHELQKPINGSVVHTPVPIPFSGSYSATVEVPTPFGWDDFEGQLYLVDVEWSADWVKQVTVYMGDEVIASWNGEWRVNSSVDLTLHMRQVSSTLYIDVRARGRGTKPTGKVPVWSIVTVMACGRGSGGLRVR